MSRVGAVLTLALGLFVVGGAAAGAGSRPVRAFGLVTMVNGSTADGTCGVAGASGNFTVVARNTSQTTIAVSSSTTFSGRDLTSPTFANVCVNETAGATGAVSGGVFNATRVRIWAPKPPRTVSAFGMVTSVNGSSTNGACGSAGAPGTFTLLGRNTSSTVVDVTSSTAFFGRDIALPTFANVCVNEMVGASGTASGGSIAAADVMIWSPVPTDLSAFGMVVSVNGSSSAGACGVAGTSGTFTVMRRNASQTVIDVTPATKFSQRHVSSPSFANVCVNEMAGARGNVSGGVLNAERVHIWSRPGTPTATAYGMVISVNGSSASGSCGVAGTSGTFTVMRRNASQTIIDVTPATRFHERHVSSPSFANVCVNETAGAAGTVSGNALQANDVRVWSPPAQP